MAGSRTGARGQRSPRAGLGNAERSAAVRACHSGSMQIAVELPDDIARHANPGREALDRLAIEGYRSGALTHRQTGPLLGMPLFELVWLLTHRSSPVRLA